MKRDLILLMLSLSFLIVFNLSFENIKLDITYLSNTIIFLVLSIFSLSLSIYFSEKIKNKYLLLPNLTVQIVFSIKNPYLSIFIIPILLSFFFKNGEGAINVSITFLFLIFFFFPVIYKPSQDILINYVLSTFNISLDKTIENIIRQQVSIDTNYAKSLVLLGFDYAVQNLPISNYSLVIELRNNLSREIEKMGSKTFEMYLQSYKDTFKENIIETIDRYKVFISTAISLAIFTTVYLYLLFVKAYYLILKTLLDKYF